MPKIVALKEDWVRLGFKLFAQKGLAGINVDHLSTTLKCNKSSFYWHFKSKNEFITHLIEYWIEIDTKSIMNQVVLMKTPQAMLKKMISIAFKKDEYLDFVFFLKKYAEGKSEILKLIDKIDQERIDFVAGILIHLGQTQEDARFRAAIFYKYLIGYHESLRNKKQFKSYMTDVLTDLNYILHTDLS